MRTARKITAVALFTAAIIAGAVLSVKSSASFLQPTGKLSVAASIYPVYFFASEIGDNKAEVIDVTPAGVEPHDYEPTAADMRKIENSRLVILNGVIEPWAGQLQQNIDQNRTMIVIAGQSLTNRLSEENGSNVTDPHVWLDPKLAEKMVIKILQGFVQADSLNADYYRQRAATLVLELDKLDAAYRSGLSECSEKDIITSHAAFGYLAAEYGLNQVSIAGLSPDTEPSPRQLVDLATFAKTNDIKYIFFESLASPKLSLTLANEIGAKTLVLDPIEGLTKDEMDAGQDYFSLMESNLANLKIALGCNPVVEF